jgi:hypothetical protein
VLDRLIDHAALFPPASMSLEEALAEHEAARASEAAFVIGRFVVPADRLDELPEERPPLSVVLSGPDDAALLPNGAAPVASRAGRGDPDPPARDPGIEALEVRLSAPRPRPSDLLAAFRALEPLAAEIYFELILDESWRDSIPAAIGGIAALGARVKLRCGGAVTPTVEQVALVIAACRDAGVPFKCTAGLHHAMRRGDEHGFLNILAATGAPNALLESVLAEEDVAALDLDAADRSLFRSFGSCSWREPVDDLEALGLLA